MSRILVENLSIKFRIYHDRSPSLKDYVSGLFRYRHQSRHSDFFALNEVSFEINEGERVGIVGHNGAGKSTLLKALCRIYEPSSGKIHVDGRIAPLLEVGAGFHPEFTGRENIYLNGSILGLKRLQILAIEPEIIKFAEMEEFVDTPVKYYSTGMYMRLAFSLATATNPDILILDEIFAGGDASFVARAKARMHDLIDRANIMIMVSHDHELVRLLCNRVIWLDHGKITADGAPGVIVDRYLAAGAATNAQSAGKPFAIGAPGPPPSQA
jgi:ABC-type polysaccharide/polyol phosphate transport system ATPase subunit